MTVVEFLLARIGEDEERARFVESQQINDPQPMGGYQWHDEYDLLYVPPVRVLAECEAKRALVRLHKSWPVLVESQPEFTRTEVELDTMTFRMAKQIAWTTEQEYRDRFGTEPPTAPMLRALASVYADHPDFQDEWLP